MIDVNIGIVSSPYATVPQVHGGGVQQVVCDLAEALTEMSHNVTAFVPNGSTVKCKTIEFGKPDLTLDPIELEKKSCEAYINHAACEFDIIHGHTPFLFEYNLKAANDNLKVCHTHHAHMERITSKPTFKLNIIAVSKWMQKAYENVGVSARYVYNGIDLEKFPFRSKKEDRLLYVGRFDPHKQPDIAIRIARALHTKIDLVGNSLVNDPIYLQKIKMMCDGENAVLHIDALHNEKVELMQKAKALLIPSNFGEPFGLVALEAMACGTPVIALNDGALGEIVKEGGIVCDSIESMIEAVQWVDRIKPNACRQNAERFSREKMARNYLALYEKIICGEEW